MMLIMTCNEENFEASSRRSFNDPLKISRGFISFGSNFIIRRALSSFTDIGSRVSFSH